MEPAESPNGSKAAHLAFNNNNAKETFYTKQDFSNKAKTVFIEAIFCAQFIIGALLEKIGAIEIRYA